MQKKRVETQKVKRDLKASQIPKGSKYKELYDAYEEDQIMRRGIIPLRETIPDEFDVASNFANRAAPNF